MTRVITTPYRYKRPPRKKQAVPLTGPATPEATTHESMPDPVLCWTSAEYWDQSGAD